MADLTITASQVLLVSGEAVDGISAAAMTAGQAVYKKTTDGTWDLADANGASAEIAGAGTTLGIVLNRAEAAGQPIRVAIRGARVTLGAGAAPAASQVYLVSTTPGALCLVSDVSTSGGTHRRSVIALGAGSNAVDVVGFAPGGAIP